MLDNYWPPSCKIKLILRLNKKMRMRKLLAATVVLLSFCIFSCKNTSTGDPKTVLMSFFDAMAKKDIATARKLATADSKQMFDIMEAGMKMAGNIEDDKTNEQFDRSKMEVGEPKIDGDRATVNVKETKGGEAVDFVLKKENGSWKVAMDMATLTGIGMQKMKEKGINEEDMQQMKQELEKFRNMDADSMKQLMNKGKQVFDSLNKELKKN